MGHRRDWATCLDCGERRMVPHREWIRASRPRCLGCGGPLEVSTTAADEQARHLDAKLKSNARRDKMTNRKRK